MSKKVEEKKEEKKVKETKKSNNKSVVNIDLSTMPTGYKIGIAIFIVGILLLVASFSINKALDPGNPYTEVNKNQTSVEDTFNVPKTATYDKQYKVYKDEQDGLTKTYSYDMFKKHTLASSSNNNSSNTTESNDKTEVESNENKEEQTTSIYDSISFEGGTITNFMKKTIFNTYIYNSDEKNDLNTTIKISFYYCNNSLIETKTYKVELKPLESRLIEIEVSDKVLNAYDYKISLGE